MVDLRSMMSAAARLYEFRALVPDLPEIDEAGLDTKLSGSYVLMFVTRSLESVFGTIKDFKKAIVGIREP